MAFIGMKIPAPTAAEFAAIQVPGTREPQEKMHLTFAFLGKEVPIPSVLKSIEICMEVASQFPPLELTAAAVMCFLRTRKGRHQSSPELLRQRFTIYERFL